MRQSPPAIAAADITAALRRYSLVGMLGWQDIKQRYRRSALGPFWLTISMGVMIGTIGLVFGTIFGSPLDEFFPFLAAGIIIWSFITSALLEGCSGFISSEGIIKQLPIPLFVHILRLLWRNIIIFLHNIVIFPLVLIAVTKAPSWISLLSIPGFALLVINLSWISLVLAIICTRYRDLPPIITNLVQVLFYLTPIMWMPKLLPSEVARYLLELNPMYHFIEIVRAPLLGEAANPISWIVAIAFAIFGWSFASIFYGRYKRRIAYWL
jgi:ABC-type polysaccharide/polyol phosphate export permease